MTRDVVELALRRERGLRYATAEALGIAYSTLQNYLTRWPDLRRVIAEAQGKLLDVAEHKLGEHVDQGNLEAIKFILKTKGKKRGYIEEKKVKHGGDPKGIPIQTQAQPPRLPTFEQLPYELRHQIIQEIRKLRALPNGLKELPLVIEGTVNGTQDAGKQT